MSFISLHTDPIAFIHVEFNNLKDTCWLDTSVGCKFHFVGIVLTVLSCIVEGQCLWNKRNVCNTNIKYIIKINLIKYLKISKFFKLKQPTFPRFVIFYTSLFSFSPFLFSLYFIFAKMTVCLESTGNVPGNILITRAKLWRYMCMIPWNKCNQKIIAIDATLLNFQFAFTQIRVLMLFI